MFVVEGRGCYSFAEIGDGFRHRSHARFVFRSQKKRAQERAVNAVAKRELGSAHALEQIFRQYRYTQQRGLQDCVPVLYWRWRQSRRRWSAGHFMAIPAPIRQPERPLIFARQQRSLVLL